ncbi:MAG TPA: hypothetical protein DHV93_01285 [Holophagaceae bacterium]|nr:hypothetical protein [Holophagaceae bacterium]
MNLLPVLLAAAAISLPAQEAALGARVHGLLPMGDLRTLTGHQIGLGLAAFVDIPVGRGLVLRPAVGAQHIPKGDALGLGGTQTRVTSVDLMVEALWFPNEDADHGPYLIGAVGGQQWRLSSTGISPATLSYTRIGISGGLGYQLSPRLGFEARGFWSPITPAITATGLMAGATVRF